MTPSTAREAPKVLDRIMKETATFLKPHGFCKHGRTLHRFVDGDISQAVTFQLGQAYLNKNHMLGVEVGIRVPECQNRTFAPDATPRRFYATSAANIRSELGIIEGRKAVWYDLRKPLEPILADILRQLSETVLPVFEALNTRDAILANRRSYPHFDQDSHLILLEEAMIHGRRGDLPAATALFRQYYTTLKETLPTDRYPDATRDHMQYVATLAKDLGIPLT